jgi:hypothetical protein
LRYAAMSRPPRPASGSTGMTRKPCSAM